MLTPDQVKAHFRERGQTVSDWAKKNGYAPRAVYLVLNGFSKGKYGQGHEIAIRLGLKKKST